MGLRLRYNQTKIQLSPGANLIGIAVASVVMSPLVETPWMSLVRKPDMIHPSTFLFCREDEIIIDIN